MIKKVWRPLVWTHRDRKEQPGRFKKKSPFRNGIRNESEGKRMEKVNKRSEVRCQENYERKEGKMNNMGKPWEVKVGGGTSSK